MGQGVDGKMAKDKATDGSIAQIVRSASVDEKKYILSPNSGSNGEESIYLREIHEVESTCLREERNKG